MDRETAKAINSVKTFKKAISKKIKVDKLIVFGSAAMGRLGKHSDIDMILVSKSFKGLDSENRGPPLYFDWPSDRPFDLICLTPQEAKTKRKYPGIVKEAIREGLEI